VQLVELDTVTAADWEQVIAGERDPWGVDETLRWRDKTHNIGLRDDAGELVALAGLVLAAVRVGDLTLEVAGIGGVIVTRAERGRGLARILIEDLLRVARELGAKRAMLFCLRSNVGLYAKLGFHVLEVPVSVRQPGGPVQMPLCAMWKPLVGSTHWPAGKVELLDEPF
jgi:GNAT superfamily N-acetyltransferase